MTARSTKVLLLDILESIEAVEEYLKGTNTGEFNKDRLVQDAVIRRIEIIGEVVKSIPWAYRKAHSSIPWTEAAGTRDVLIHSYFGVELNRVWLIATQRLPALKVEVQKLLKELP